MDQQTLIEALPLLIAGIAVVIALGAHVRFSSVRRSLLVLQGNQEGKTLIDAVADYSRQVGTIAGDIRALSERQDQLFKLLGRSARNLSIIRYDAFEEMGGRLSFSAALLNDHGDGLVISSINGRSESRVYAKEIRQADSEHTLSPEEQQAIAQALGAVGKVKVKR